MSWFSQIRSDARTQVRIQEGLFFLGCFFVLLFQVRPTLIFEDQPLVFFKGIRFLGEFLQIPGGLADWLSSLCMQFWFSDSAGALCLTLCFWVVTLLTRMLMKMILGNRPVHTWHLIPAAFLLVLHGSTGFRPSVTVALIFNLAALILFLRLVPETQAPKAQIIRMATGLMAAVLLFWFTGGAFFIFAVLLGLVDIFSGKRIISGLILLTASAVLPAAAAASVFLVPVRQAYLHNLPFENPFKIRIIGYGIPAFYLAAAVFSAIMKSPAGKKTSPLKSGSARAWKLAAGAVLLAGGAFLASQKSLDDAVRSISQVNQSMRKECWNDALESARHCRAANPLISFQTNLALFKTGVLLDKMFAFPQTEGTVGLVLNHAGCLEWPEEASALCLKLGLVGESQHWAHEALELKGATPGILKQLSILYLLKGEREASDRFSRALGKIPFQAKAAESLLQCNGDPSKLASTDGYASILSYMPTEDFISLGEISSHNLALLVKRNPKNRMAFEYLIAHYLLAGDLKMVKRGVIYFYALAYPKIPIHVQEALLLQNALERKLDPTTLKTWCDPLIFKRFIAYQQVIGGYRGNKAAAQQELRASFGDTFWYYLMFIKPASRQSEYQNEYQ